MTAARRIGQFEVTAVSDGVIEASIDVALGTDHAESRRRACIDERGTIEMPVNVFLVALAGKLALIDTGASDTLGPRTGKLVENLRALGVLPQEIDYIFLTHWDPDHSNGLVDGAGEPIYTEAEVFVRDEDAAFWLDHEVDEATPQRLRRRMAWAQRASAPYRRRLHRVRDGEVLPGVSSLLSNGHTPGHAAWVFRSGGSGLVAWGDTVHLPRLQIPHPEIGVIFDVDPAAAAAARLRMFEFVLRENLLVAGVHLDHPGFYHLRAEDSRYRVEAA